MILSEMGPDTAIEVSSDLGSRDFDQDFDWIGDVRRRYPNLDLSADFIQQARNIGLDDNDRLDTTPVVDCQTLNVKQLMIFRRIESHYIELLINSARVEPLRLILMGTAGTGKSYLIKMI